VFLSCKNNFGVTDTTFDFLSCQKPFENLMWHFSRSEDSYRAADGVLVLLSYKKTVLELLIGISCKNHLKSFFFKIKRQFWNHWYHFGISELQRTFCRFWVITNSLITSDISTMSQKTVWKPLVLLSYLKKTVFQLLILFSCFWAAKTVCLQFWCNWYHFWLSELPKTVWKPQVTFFTLRRQF